MPPPTLRDTLLVAMSDARAIVDGLGLRRIAVYTRARRWYSGTAGAWAPADRGVGYPVDTEAQVLPTPRVREISGQYLAGSAGRYREGDIRIDKITPRSEPATGAELWQFDAPVVDANLERHIVLVETSGTPHHHHGGTARPMIPGPHNLATGIVAANALRTAMADHWADPYAHTAPGDPSPAPGTVATDSASLVALASALRAAWAAHRAAVPLHPQADVYPLTAPAPVDLQGALVCIHDVLQAMLQHVAPGGVAECTVVEALAERAFTHALVVRPTRRTP